MADESTWTGDIDNYDPCPRCGRVELDIEEWWPVFVCDKHEGGCGWTNVTGYLYARIAELEAENVVLSAEVKKYTSAVLFACTELTPPPHKTLVASVVMTLQDALGGTTPEAQVLVDHVEASNLRLTPTDK